MDKTALAILGISQADKSPNRLDLSAALKDRYHHRLTYADIARKYGVSTAAVHERLQKFTAQLGDPEELRSFQDMEADVQSAIKRRFSSKLLEVDLDKTSPKDLAMVYGITYDKHRLQTGQATNQVSVFFHIVAESDQSTPVDNSPEDAIIVHSE